MKKTLVALAVLGNVLGYPLLLAIWAAIAYGRPLAIDANIPDREYICPRLARICRAHHVATVPLSEQTMASSRRRLPNSHATTSGFIGTSARVPRSSTGSARRW